MTFSEPSAREERPNSVSEEWLRQQRKEGRGRKRLGRIKRHLVMLEALRDRTVGIDSDHVQVEDDISGR